MIIKKLTSFMLLLLFIFSTTTQMSLSTSLSKKGTLADFIENNDKIEAKFDYPSMKLSSNAGNRTLLPANTAITIRCHDNISANNFTSGSTVNFYVVNDVKASNGAILVKAGAPVSAQVTFAESNGMIGKSGKITISDFHTTAVDGTYIPLSGTISSNPDDKMVMSILLSVFVCPLFLIMKGADGTLQAGTTKTAYTTTNVYIKAVRI